MSRIAYVNGRYCQHREAAVHIEDRGFQLSDSVYEVWGVRPEGILDEALHFDRLLRSLNELRIKTPCSVAAMKMILREVLRRNRISHGRLYLQITRGVAPRDHAFPAHPVRPTLVVTAARANVEKLRQMAKKGVAVITLPDQRWGRCDIKSTALLANVLAKQTARDQGAYEAWLVDGDGFVTEGASTNAWILDKNNVLRTRSVSTAILGGITRKVLLAAAAAEGIEVSERAFTREEAFDAREAFISASSAILIPVVSIDSRPIGTGMPGPMSEKLRNAYKNQSIIAI